MDRFELFHFLTQEQRNTPLFNGRIDTEKLNILSRTIFDPTSVNHYFLCGPEAMIFTIRDFLTDRGVPKECIHFELFFSGSAAKPKKRREVQPNAGQSTVRIQEGGKQFSFSIPKGSDNILDAALQHQADLPYACKGGVCCTCKAKLVKGDVEVLVNYGLEQEEIDQGYILTCQAMPQSEEVVVDFDAAIAN
jgi:ring-1,2-phenylacetyl-CoA epoxidase subunit PaaE